MPLGATVRRRYCSRKCNKASAYALEAEARAEARKGRSCARCGGPVPEHLDARAIYCSRSCEKRASLARYRSKNPPNQCPVCETMFHPYPSKQVCCSYACRDELKKRRNS